MRRVVSIVAALAALAAAMWSAPTSWSATPAGTVDNCIFMRNGGREAVACQYSGQIPPASVFYRSPATTCRYVDDLGVYHDDGTAVAWLEGLSPVLKLLSPEQAVSLEAWLAQQVVLYGKAVRAFTSTCNGFVNGFIAVPVTDPFFVPGRSVADSLRLGIVFPDPGVRSVPDRALWGGLVVNNPTLIGVDAASWRDFSNSGTFRAWPTRLVARPSTLEVTVDGTVVPCISSYRPADQTTAMFPPEPAGFRSSPFDPPSNPLASRPCVWTPRKAGRVTVRTTITYSVWLEYGTLALVRPVLVRTTTAVLDVVDLADVNVLPS